LPFGEGETAGEGLAAGLAVFTGAVVVGTAGEADVDGAGLAVVGVFELFSSVAQPAANPIESVATISSAVRLIKLMFGVVISFFLVPARLKSGMMIAPVAIRSNGCSHRNSGEISARSAPKASFSKACLHD